MLKETLVFVAGILTVLIPFLGIPEEWKLYGLVAVGGLLIFIGYALRREAFLRQIDHGNGERGTDSFVENTKNLFEPES